MRATGWIAPALLAAATLVSGARETTAQQRPFVERVEVARILIDVRALDDDGRPITGLEPDDFAVEIDTIPVRVESAEWIGASAPLDSGSPAAAPAGAAAATKRAPGRLIVFLVQRDLTPVRILGLMQMGRLADSLLEPFSADDRVAVLSFDSRLRVWTDFTNDLDAVRTVLARDVIVSHPPPAAPATGVSLLAGLDREDDTRIFGIEHALRRIGESLERLPGAKTVVLLGYGFGRFNARTGGVLLMDGYEEASAALQRARVSVFTVNVTRADFNSLQAGLQTVSEETGGTYASTYEFPQRALRRLADALAGHYVLFVEKPPLAAGTHPIEVRLSRRDGTVVARRTYAEPSP